MSPLSDYFYEQAQKALSSIDPVPPAPNSSRCELGGTQDTDRGPAGAPSIDWGIDTRAAHRLTDAELLDKMRWQLNALRTREQLQRAFERLLPTVHPEVK